LVDGHLENLSADEIRDRVAGFMPHFTVVTTAPSYLFWRCPPPELRVPQQTVRKISGVGGITIAVGPHCSTTPRSAINKLGVDVIIIGEFEDILPKLARAKRSEWGQVESICFRRGGIVHTCDIPHAVDVKHLPALRWTKDIIDRHTHHHHRFDASPSGPGAEMESSRGCPYRCSFCAKENFRSEYRKRPLETVQDELDGLVSLGVEYTYFVDEIFLPDSRLLLALCDRPLKFGVQTRLDLWSREMLVLLGKAGCVSIEAGVESISDSGRLALMKKCSVSFEELTDRLIYAKKHVPFVQANLIETKSDTPEEIERWREHLKKNGVWANEPVPVFPYPGSPLYKIKWGSPDDMAWERAHEYYLSCNTHFSDIQDQKPLPLEQLELRPPV
jgi:B12-binding domain/radical SAM domain protein of rhizo-twelve system